MAVNTVCVCVSCTFIVQSLLPKSKWLYYWMHNSSCKDSIIVMAALCNRGGGIIFLPCSFFLSSSIFFFFFYSSPNLGGRRLDVYHTWCGLSANLECRSERCCTRLAANAGPKKVAKNRHLGTIPQLCRAISSQLMHVSTIGKTC